MAATLYHLETKHASVPLIFEQNSYLPLVSLQLIFRDSGALTDSIPGVAKLATKLLGEGCRDMGSTAFATALEDHAISLSASVGSETMVITLSALKSEFAFALKMLKKLLKSPNFSDEAFERIQAQMLGKLTQKQSDFDYVAGAKLRALLFAGTPRAHPVDGTPESVSAITMAQLKRHIKDSLAVGNLIAVAGGDLDEAEIRAAVLEIAELLGEVSPPPLPAVQMIETPTVETVRVKTDQAYIYFGAPYEMPYDSDEVYLGKVAAFVLGSGGFGSRMMEEIRVKRGLAYSAYCSFHVSHTVSYFSGYLQTKLESAEEAQQVVREVVKHFCKEGMTQEELDAAKQFLVGSEPLRNETLQQRIANAFHAYYNGKALDWREEELRRIASIDLAQINHFIQSHTEITEISFAVVRD